MIASIQQAPWHAVRLTDPRARPDRQNSARPAQQLRYQQLFFLLSWFCLRPFLVSANLAGWSDFNSITVPPTQRSTHFLMSIWTMQTWRACFDIEFAHRAFNHLDRVLWQECKPMFDFDRYYLTLCSRRISPTILQNRKYSSLLRLMFWFDWIFF